MQSGRVLPVIRQFFTTSLTAKSATDSNPQNQQQKQQERDPSEEEAKAAFQLLLEQEEFKAQGLTVEMKTIEGKPCIIVCDSTGTQLRMIKGQAILKVLQTTVLGKDAHFRGRILDRRL
jgi:uncharacterized lipoprotein